MSETPSRLARFAAALLGTSAALTAISASPDPQLAAAVASPARTASFVARDKARHPVEELSFFGIAPTMTVVELWPGGGYWTEILGPYLAKSGTYYVALACTGQCRGRQISRTVAHAVGRSEGSHGHHP